MNIALKVENGDLYWGKDGVLKKLNNESYLTASQSQSGLMSSTDKIKLDTLQLLGTNHEVTEHTTPVLKDSNNNLYIQAQAPELLEASDLAFTKWKYTPTNSSGVYRVASNATYNDNVVTSYLRGTSPAGFTSTPSNEINNWSYYTSRESSNTPMFIMHKITVSRMPQDAHKIIHLKVRLNHSIGTYGVAYMSGNTPVIRRTAYDSNSAIRVEDRYFDISNITGTTIVIFVQASRWATWYSQLPITYLPRSVAKGNTVGNYSEFAQVRDNLPVGSVFFITNINNNKGCIAMKVAEREWRDSLGNIINSSNHRVTI